MYFVFRGFLMTGPTGNSRFCICETPTVPQGEAGGALSVKGNQTHCFAWGQSPSVLLYLTTQKQNKLKKLFA